MNELQRMELEELSQENEHKQQFVIKDLQGLNWAFRKMNALQAAIKDVKQLADAERERIARYEKSEMDKYSGDLSFFEQKIKEYHENELLRDHKVKSIKTPYGTVKSTTIKATPDKTNEQALIDYVKRNELAFVEKETKVKLLWGELKKTLHVVEIEGLQMVVDSNGEIVPGVIVKPETTTFKVEVGD